MSDPAPHPYISISMPAQLLPDARAQPPAATSASPVFSVFLCGTFAFIDLYCTQPLLPLLSHVFRASEARVSLTISASTLGVALSALLLALFAQAVDRKRTIVLSIGALALCTLATAASPNLPVLALLRFLQGLVTPGIFIITIAYITEEWAAVEVPRVMSVYVAGTVFGGFLGRLSGGLLGARFGWRAVFLILGTAGLVGMLLVQRLLRPGHKPARSRAASPFTPFLQNLRNPRLRSTFAIGFCMLYTLVAVFSYITFYLADPPFSLSTRALSWLFAVYLCGLGATLVAGRVLVRVGLRTGILAAIALSLAGLALTLFPSLPMVAAGLALVGSGVFIAQVCANSFLRDAAPPETRVCAAGMYICFYYVGGTVGGMLPGLLWHFGKWPGCAALTAALLVLAAATASIGWRAPRPEPIPL